MQSAGGVGGFVGVVVVWEQRCLLPADTATAKEVRRMADTVDCIRTELVMTVRVKECELYRRDLRNSVPGQRVPRPAGCLNICIS
jgi:hypothetical protein